MAWQADHGAEVLININGSPYHAGKRVEREKMVAERASDYGAFVAYVNTVGGQDELVFDGNSVVFGPRGEMLAHAARVSPTAVAATLNDEVLTFGDVEFRAARLANGLRSHGCGAWRSGAVVE